MIVYLILSLFVSSLCASNERPIFDFSDEPPLVAVELNQILQEIGEKPPLKNAEFKYDDFMDEERAQRILDGVVEHTQVQRLPDMINRKIIEFRPSYNATLLIGEPGVGKSTIMKAVARLVGPEWTPVVITEAEIHKEGGKRNASLAAFCSIIEEKRRMHKNVLVMVNEFHGWLEHYGSENHDTGVLSQAIQNYLDTWRHDPTIFFMATVNAFDKVPDTIKSRFHRCTYEIHGFADQETSTREFFRFLESFRFILHEAEKAYLTQKYEELGLRYPRESYELAAQIKADAYSKSPRDAVIVTITRAAIDYSFANSDRTASTIKLHQKVLSDEERRHEENKQMHYEDVARSNKWGIIGTTLGVIGTVAAAPIVVPLAGIGVAGTAIGYGAGVVIYKGVPATYKFIQRMRGTDVSVPAAAVPAP